MRVAAFAFAILSMGALTAVRAEAQNYGPPPYGDDPRSGPPRYSNERPPRPDNGGMPYFTDRAPPGRGGEGFQQPPQYRGAPPDDGHRYDRMGDGRPDSRPQPYPQDREPPVGRRRVEQGPPPGGERETRTTIWPPVRGAGAPPPQHTAGRPVRPAPQNAEQMTIPVAEFRDLENRVRELERMLAERQDFREPPRQSNRPPVIYR